MNKQFWNKLYEQFHVFQEGLEVENEKGDKASWFKQLSTLTRRSFVNMCRDVGYYWLRIIIYVIVSLCVGTIYFNVGTSYTAIFARGACGAFITGFMTFMTIGGFPSFIEEMKVKHLTLEKKAFLSRVPSSLGLTIFCFSADVLQRKAQWLLWSYSVYIIKLYLFFPVLGFDLSCFWHHHLLHGEISAGVLPLPILLPQYLWLHFCNRRVDDGCGFIGSKLPNGNYNRRWNHCKNSINLVDQRPKPVYLFHILCFAFPMYNLHVSPFPPGHNDDDLWLLQIVA